MNKICTKCKEEKSLSEFYHNKASKDGFTCHCKLCMAKYQRQQLAPIRECARVDRLRKENQKERICNKCKEEKPIEEFSFYTRPKKDGSQSRKVVCKVCISKHGCDYSKEHPEKRRKHRRKRVRKHRFAMVLSGSREKAKEREHMPCTATKEEIEAAFTGKCHVCLVPEIECRTRLCLDHDHTTGEFRGWLCSNCNNAAGHLKDSVALTYNLLEYLAKAERKEHGPQETTQNSLPVSRP